MLARTAQWQTLSTPPSGGTATLQPYGIDAVAFYSAKWRNLY
jgi:hypothetical protein